MLTCMYTFASNNVSDRNSFAYELIEKRKYIVLKSFRRAISKKA